MEVSTRRILDIDELTSAELSLVSCAQTGSWWDRTQDGSFGPAVSSTKSDEANRAVRSEVVYQLLSGHGELSLDSTKKPVAVRAVRMIGAVIIGQLDLRQLAARCPLEIVSCGFKAQTGPVLLEGASFPYLTLRHSNIPGLNGNGLHVRGETMMRGLVSREPVFLNDAQISGTLNLQAAMLGSAGSSALVAEGIAIGGHLLANAGFTSDGEINLINATVKSQFNLDGAYLSNPGADALLAEGIKVGGSIFMRTNFAAEGRLLFSNAEIAAGLYLNNAHLTNQGLDTIDMSLATISGDLQAVAGFQSEGTMRLMGTTVEGSVILSGATLKAAGNVALAGDRARIRGSLFARTDFAAEGSIRLPDAEIGLELAFDGAHLSNPGGIALVAPRVSVGGGMSLRADAVVQGQIRLAHSTITGPFSIIEVQLQNAGDCALDLEYAVLKSSLMLKPKVIEGFIDLTGASAAEYIDNESARRTPARLAGFKYEALRPEPPTVSVKKRIRWLATDPDGYAPNAYTQLADVMRKRGHAPEAKRILVESQRQRWRRSGPLRMPYGTWSALLRFTFGYGYRPWLVLAWLAAVIAGGSVYFDSVGTSAFTEANGAPPFNALLYTIDSLLPFVDLGYSKWVPKGSAHAVSSVVVIVGWLLASALVAALAGLFRRGD